MKCAEIKLQNDASIELAVMNVLINGEQQEIIPAFTEKSVQSKDLKKGDIEIDEDRLLPSLFCFADASPYRAKGVALFDANGVEIPSILPEEAPQVFVYLDKSDTVNLIRFVDNPVRAEIIHMDSVEEAVRRIALSNYVAKPLTKTNWRKLALVASGTLQKIVDFAVEHKISIKTAQCYFGINPSMSCLQKTAIFSEDFLASETPRDMESAERLYRSVADKFGAKFARQTRHAQTISTCVNEIGLESFITKLQSLPDEAVKELKGLPRDMIPVKLALRLGKTEQSA